jgi:hypothetical protein
LADNAARYRILLEASNRHLAIANPKYDSIAQ